MKKYTAILCSYSLDELSEEAKEKAYDDYRRDFFDFWNCGTGTDYAAVAKLFSQIFDVQLDWHFDGYYADYRFSICNDIFSNENMSKIRLAKYIWNNYSRYIEKGKYYSISGKSRTSKIQGEGSGGCPLTGMAYDVTILSPIWKCLTYSKLYNSYKELIGECLHDFFLEMEYDAKYLRSKEYFEEISQVNEWQYRKNGDFFTVPDCDEIKCEEMFSDLSL